jgi:chaperone BCS1
MKEIISTPTALLILGSLTGYIMSQGTSGLKKAFTSIKERLIHSVKVEQESDLFKVVSLFLQSRWSKSFRSTTAKWSKANKEMKPTFTPNNSTFVIRYGGKNLMVSCNQERMDKMEWGFGLHFATITISGIFAKRTIGCLLQEAMDKYSSDRSPGSVGIFIKRGYDGIGEINEVYPKPLNSLIYKGHKQKKIKRDIDEFLSNEKWYRDRGIPYKRCFCLYGPPGTGKTSLVLSIALEFRRDIYLLDLCSCKEEEDLIRAIALAPANAIVVVEDADRTLAKSDLRLSISSLLNILDGPFTRKGLLLFMTTNHIERIDPAILRDGRIDVKEEIGHAGKREVEAYLRLFYNTAVALPVEIELPMASVQEICIRNKNNVQAAIDEIAAIEQCAIVP